MQYALVDGRRRQARKGSNGICPDCGAPMVAKCGSRVLHHWAHRARRDCDPWWEGETEWHRRWKGYFPEECREVSHTAADGEVHRADIKTPTGIVIEVQHSTMTDQERESRELFYPELIWIVDGRGFRSSFELGRMLPDPGLAGWDDIIWFQGPRRAFPGCPKEIEASVPLFWRISEAAQRRPGLNKANFRSVFSREDIPLVEVHSGEELKERVSADYRGHHQFHWVRPRRTWLDAVCPVYLDFGEEVLYKLEEYDESGMQCIQLVAVEKVIHDAMVERRAADIGIRFYPIA